MRMAGDWGGWGLGLMQGGDRTRRGEGCDSRMRPGPLSDMAFCRCRWSCRNSYSMAGLRFRGGTAVYIMFQFRRIRSGATVCGVHAAGERLGGPCRK